MIHIPIGHSEERRASRERKRIMSKITIEQVEKLQSRANVSYEEARDALEKCDGDILEALIQLEKDGKTAKPGGGAYSTNNQAGPDPYGDNSSCGQNQDQNSGYRNYQGSQYNNGPSGGQGGQNGQGNQGGPQMNYQQGQYRESDFSKQAKSVWKSFLELLHKGNINHFVIRKNGQEVVRMPINILVILLIIFNAAALIALIVFLFFGFRYSFEGPARGNQSFNDVMDSASSTADDIKENVKNAASDDQNSDPNGSGPNNGQQ